jgi:membrane-associated HD superfamily phosphohydrolase
MSNKLKYGRTLLVILITALILLQPFAVIALTSSEAKQDWYEAKDASREAQEAHRDAKIEWAVNKTEENNQEVIDTGKESLHAALDEAEAWLIWRNLEVQENPEIPTELKEAITSDVEENLAKIDELRAEVDDVENRLELGLVFLKMVGKYLELVTDVARNSGLVWVHIANNYTDTIEEYEQQLRTAADTLGDSDEIIEKLDMASDELAEARENIEDAESEYNQVVIPGTPLMSFANGNQHLRIAKNHLISAHGYLRQAYRLMVETS